MASYGEPVGSYHPDKLKVYDAFTTYFANPIMVKTRDIDLFSVYKTKIHCLLSRQCRYILVFVVRDNMDIGTSEEMRNLQWKSLQTRTMEERHTELTPHSFTPSIAGGMGARLVRTEITDDASTYSCDTFPPIIITMLHKKSGESEYHNSGTLAAALETYQTVITFKT